MVTPQSLSEHLGGTSAPAEVLTQVITEAEAMVTAIIGAQKIPEVITDRAILETAADLYGHRSAPNGIKAFGDLDGASPVRIRLDPLAPAKAILAPFLKVVMA
ncbi:hypothetical protein [uncultured Mobiluncus sp.]|uniref:hypothetical protein n=1 Tax=uncultured Mobiluncus sp. TaxID=293425 RepID=UPI002617B32E|nr:hypothetical protein [uncultured Mobiluncus sp.]